MRSRAASAATARTFSLVIQPGFDRERAAVVVADTSRRNAIEEALAYLGLSLFHEDDRVASDAVDVLTLALGRRVAREAA